MSKRSVLALSCRKIDKLILIKRQAKQTASPCQMQFLRLTATRAGKQLTADELTSLQQDGAAASR